MSVADLVAAIDETPKRTATMLAELEAAGHARTRRRRERTEIRDDRGVLESGGLGEPRPAVRWSARERAARRSQEEEKETGARLVGPLTAFSRRRGRASG
jgi:hypothetical protein